VYAGEETTVLREVRYTCIDTCTFMLLVRPAQLEATVLCYPLRYLKPENTSLTFLWKSRDKKWKKF
jgi:hypothetical protein